MDKSQALPERATALRFRAAPRRVVTEVFTSVGLGGGGAMFAPAISPHDSNLLFVGCDMGGIIGASTAAGAGFHAWGYWEVSLVSRFFLLQWRASVFA